MQASSHHIAQEQSAQELQCIILAPHCPNLGFSALTCLSIKSLGKLIDGRGNLKAMSQDSSLSLKPDVPGPFHKAGQVSLWLDILTWIENKEYKSMKSMLKYVNQHICKLQAYINELTNPKILRSPFKQGVHSLL